MMALINLLLTALAGGGVGAAGAIAAGGSVSTAVTAAGGIGGIVMSIFPYAKALLDRIKARNADVDTDVDNKAISSIFDVGQHVVDFIHGEGASGDSDKGASIGVEFLWLLKGPQLEALGITKDSAKKIVTAFIAKHKPSVAAA
jgi:hypothetical protein